MLKVLHIEDRFHPDMGYQPNFFAKYHSPGYKFYLLTSDSFSIWECDNNKETIKIRDKEFEDKNNITIIRLNEALVRENRNNLWMKKLIKTIDQINPDIIYAHALESLTSLRIVLSGRILTKYRIYFDTHTLLNQFNHSLKFKLYLWLIKKIISRRLNKKNIKIFATVNENSDILSQVYGIKKENILYAPIGTDLEIFHFDNSARASLRKQFNLGEEDVALLYTGKMNYQKSPHLILHAVKNIEKDITGNLHIFFIGPARNKYIGEQFSEKILNENIHLYFLPAAPVHELYQWYSMADFAVFPKENSLSALDAQACQLPVIMEKDTTNSERTKEGGLVYEKGNLKHLSEQILIFLKDTSFRKNKGKAGAAYIRQKYDYRLITGKMEEDMGLK